MEVTLEIDAADIARIGLRQYLRGMRDRARDFRPVEGAALDVIFEHNFSQIMSEGAAGGEEWAPLSKRYEEIKSEVFAGRGLLRLTNHLMRQLSGLSGDHYERRMRTKLVMASNLPIKWSGGQDDLAGLMQSGRPGDPTFAGPPLVGPAHSVRGWHDWVRPGSRRVPPMPARPPLVATEGEAEELAEIFANHVMGGEPA